MRYWSETTSSEVTEVTSLHLAQDLLFKRNIAFLRLVFEASYDMSSSQNWSLLSSPIINVGAGTLILPALQQ